MNGICGNTPFGGPPDLFGEPTQTRTPGILAQYAMADSSIAWDNGKELLIYFLNGTDAWGRTIRDAVERLSGEWTNYANLGFTFVNTKTAHVTINLNPIASAGYGMYSSYLGKDCREAILRNVPSMNLVFPPTLQEDPARMEEEFERVIRHEFGHMIGMVHEHMRPDRPIKWDLYALNAYCAKYFGWSANTVKNQIVDVYQPKKEGALVASSFDPNSIMMYQYPAGVASYNDGTAFVTPNNTSLTPMDKVVAAMTYPVSVPDLPEQTVIPNGASIPESIGRVGEVVRLRFSPVDAGDHTISVRGQTPVLLSLLSQRKQAAGRMLAAEGVNAKIDFHPNNPGQDYFIEVRHAKPTSGTGSFAVSVTSASRKVVEPATPTTDDQSPISWDDAGA